MPRPRHDGAVERLPALPPPSTLGWLDWSIVALYLLASVAAGLVVSRRAGSGLEAFFLSGRRLPWWLMGTSLVAVSFSSDTPLIVTAWTRADGVAGNWRWWGYTVGTLLVVVLFARLWRRSGVLTDVEFIELRYSGRPAVLLRVFKALYQVVFVHCLVLGWVFLSLNKLLASLLDLGTDPLFHVPLAFGLAPVPVTPGWLALLVCVVLTFAYCETAGLWGVVATDFLQFPVAMGGAIALAWAVVSHLGGLDALSAGLAASADAAKLSGAPAGHELLLSAPPTEWTRELWNFVVMVGLLWCANKNADGGGMVIQRMLAARDERHALLGTLWYAIMNFALRGWPWILVALATLLVLPGVSVVAPVAGTVLSADGSEVLISPADGSGPVAVPVPDTGLPDWRARPTVEAGDRVAAGVRLAATDDEQAYPVMMRRFLPAGLLGFLVASFLAAFMSTVDSHINLAGAYLVNDVYKRLLRPDETPEHYVRAARWATPLVVVGAFAFAASAGSVREMFDSFTQLFGGVGVVYLLRWCWWRVNVWSEVAVLATSVAITLLLDVWPEWFAGLLPEGLLAGGRPTFSGGLVLVFAASLVVVLPVTLLTPPVEREHLARFVQRVRPPGWWGPVARADRAPGAVRESWARLVLAWAGGVAAVFGLIFLQGAWFLHAGRGAWGWGLCAVGGLLLFFLAMPGTREQAPGHRAGPS